ncbi:MAG: DUF3787 domain-containing protein [Eubacterium sp.]|nr:DUF3787 domain-containing protein [Eubacterium sp.]
MITKNEKSHALNGTHNQRINKTVQTDNTSTAAWTKESRMTPKANVSVPDTSAVEHAKEWVDNGSRL